MVKQSPSEKRKTEDDMAAADITGEWRDRIDADLRAQRTDMHNLGERVAGVESGITNLGRSFDRFSRSFEDSKNLQQESQKTRWPVVFAGIGVVLVIIGGFSQGYLRDLNRVEGQVSKIQAKRVSAKDPVQDARLAELEGEIRLIRAEEQKILQRDADSSARIDVMMQHRHEIIEHTRDGHPHRIEKELHDLQDDLKEFKADAKATLARELAVGRDTHAEMMGVMDNKLDSLEKVVEANRGVSRLHDEKILGRVEKIEERYMDEHVEPHSERHK